MTNSLQQRSFWSLGCLATVVLTGLIVLAAPARAQTAPQAVSLVPGWNSIWLEVEPVYPPGDPKAGQPKAPADVFGPTAVIDIVATPKPLAGSAEFFGSEPGSLTTITTFNKADWQQWKRTDVASSNNLSSIFGNRPYLIHTTGAATVNLTGKVRFFRPTWIADRYNLLGFGLEGTRTFSDFFTASGTRHPVDKIFTLNAAGSWVHVTAGQTMDANKAYWIYSSGPSTYMGPVALDFGRARSTGSLDYAGPGDAVTVGADTLDLKELTFTNSGTASATPSATAVSVDSALALYRVTPAPDSLSYVRGNGFLAAFVPVAAQGTVTLTIGAKRTFTDDAVHTSLYRIKSGAAGASFYLPVTAVRSEVQQTVIGNGGTPANSVSGLWVGDVVVNGASSIVVDGAPIQPSAGSAPLRIILHSDAGGAVRLLSQVTLMQTKTADPEGSGVPALVVDPAKIPFFEGIKVRDGKRVGVRIEAVAYDMPRSASAWTGAPLITFATRPTTLQETYDLSRTMSGAIGGTVTTTLSLDPFHRSNPLRHAFHQDLTKGPQINRTITLVFDPSQAGPDHMSASFSDTIQGLIKDNLTLTGHVELRRVSPVATLQGQ